MVGGVRGMKKKEGPCRHCGITSTPLWRHGPPDKLVLCNACGSRWRTKGTLENYFPLHAREQVIVESKLPKLDIMHFKQNQQNSHQRNQGNGPEGFVPGMQNSGQNFQKVMEEDGSNRSSSGSAVSYSESCAQFSTKDASELTASAQSSIWDQLVPSRKRTCIVRRTPSSVERLTKDLRSFLREQQSCFPSGTPDEDLLYDDEIQSGSIELGHGGFLIRPPNSKAIDEESEASSFSVDNISCIVSNAYLGSTFCHVSAENNATVGRHKKSAAQKEQRDNSSRGKLHILQDRDSPLGSIDLKDVISFETFTGLLSHGEQQQLMTFLPSVDTISVLTSVKSIFCSPQFLENLSYLQQLLQEGVLDLSFSDADTEACRTLKEVTLTNLAKSRWVEHYDHLKHVKDKKDTRENGRLMTSNVLEHSDCNPLKRLRDSQSQIITEQEDTVGSPRRTSELDMISISTSESSQLRSGDDSSTLIYGTDHFFDSEERNFSPSSLFASPERSSIFASFQLSGDNASQDHLLGMPSCKESYLKQTKAVPRRSSAKTAAAKVESSKCLKS